MAFGFDALEQFPCGFVGAAFSAGDFRFVWDQVSAEGFSENWPGEFVGSQCGRTDALVDCIGKLEEGFDPADDLLLLIDGRKWDKELPKVANGHTLMTSGGSTPPPLSDGG